MTSPQNTISRTQSKTNTMGTPRRHAARARTSRSEMKPAPVIGFKEDLNENGKEGIEIRPQVEFGDTRDVVNEVQSSSQNVVKSQGEDAIYPGPETFEPKIECETAPKNISFRSFAFSGHSAGVANVSFTAPATVMQQKHEIRPADEKHKPEHQQMKRKEVKQKLTTSTFPISEKRQEIIAKAIDLYRLKRIDLSTISCAIGMPVDNVAKALQGNIDALRSLEWDKLMSIIGLDPATGLLQRGTPHFIYLDKATKATFTQIAHLFENTKAARIRCLGQKMSWFDKSPGVVVFQNDHLRVVVVERERTNAMQLISGVLGGNVWFAETEKKSLVKANIQLERFIAGDLSAIDFDAIFSLNKINWAYVDMVARANRVSIEEVLSFIKAEGDRKEQEGNGAIKAVKAAVNQ